MPGTFIERERKFDVDADFAVPDLTGAVPPGSTTVRSVQRLRSDYFDTADHALRSAGITFRRRTGTDDVGWHLKLPHGEHREELHADLSDDPPAALTTLLLGVTRGAPLAPVATLETERHVTRVVDADGDSVADIDLDHVQATTAADGRTAVTSWTELEVELGSPSVSDEQLAVLARRLRDSGARPPSSASKLVRALGAAAPEQRPKRGKRRKPQRAGEVLLPYLAEQQRALLLGDIALRRGDDSVIHPTRVATRRLRSVLRVFSPFFDPGRRAALDGELRWYAELLGAVRDGQVLERRLDAAVAGIAPELVLGPVRQRIDAHLDGKRADDLARLRAALHGTRYLDLLGEVASWTDAPPFTARARRSDATVLRLARTAERKVAKRLRSANRDGDVDLLHAARKAAKRARYAAEAAQPVGGRRVLQEVKRYRRLQDVLGEHQDSVVAARLLLELGAGADGATGFTFGLLHQREQDRAAAARRKARKAARRLH